MIVRSMSGHIAQQVPNSGFISDAVIITTTTIEGWSAAGTHGEIGCVWTPTPGPERDVRITALG